MCVCVFGMQLIPELCIVNLLPCIRVGICIFACWQYISVRADRWKMLFREPLPMETMLNGRYMSVMCLSYATQTVDPLLSRLCICRTNFQCVARYTRYHKCPRILTARMDYSAGQVLLSNYRYKLARVKEAGVEGEWEGMMIHLPAILVLFQHYLLTVRR